MKTRQVTPLTGAAARRWRDRQSRELDEWIRQFMPCRRHGAGCRVPWGYDQDHADSDRPYTVDELAARREGPHRYAYPSYEAYKDGWRLWVALHRDAQLTVAEADVVWNLRLDRMEGKARAAGEDLSELIARFRR